MHWILVITSQKIKAGVTALAKVIKNEKSGIRWQIFDRESEVKDTITEGKDWIASAVKEWTSHLLETGLNDPCNPQRSCTIAWLSSAIKVTAVKITKIDLIKLHKEHSFRC